MTTATEYRVVQLSSVDISQREVVATFGTRDEAAAYIRENSVDQHGNISDDDDCDYLAIDGEDT